MTTEITLLGGFAVTQDGVRRPEDGWRRRQAAGLVKLLALAPGRRLHREQVIDALWPDNTIDEAGPRLHKAAFYARKALDDPQGLLLRADVVELLPDADVVVDAIEFETAAVAALRAGDRAALDGALQRCAGELLPGDPYEEWLDARRARLAELRLDVLRQLGRWDEVVALEPADESAQLALIRALAEAGDHTMARYDQFERLERALSQELGVGPSPEVVRMRNELASQPVAPPTTTLVARVDEQVRIRGLLVEVAAGRGRTLLIQGVGGIGKTSLLDWVADEAGRTGWRIGRGTGDAVVGRWAYAPVLDALADVCRRQPTLLDGLDDAYRSEIDRALTGGDLHWSGEGGHQRLFVATAELLRLASADRGLVVILDDLHDADDASLRLVHYLARCTADERILLVLAHRPVARDSAFAEMRTRLIGPAGAAIELAVLNADESLALVHATRADLDEDEVQRVVSLAGGLPFALTELALRARSAPWEQSLDHVLLGALDAATRETLQAVAVLGATFDTDELIALTGLADDEAFGVLDRAIEARLVEHTGSHYRFRHALVRDALVADIAPHRRRRIHRSAADGLAGLDSSPARIGRHLVAAGEPAAAAPYLLRAAEREAAVGAYRDALELIDAVMGHVHDDERAAVLAMRADILFALGDPDATVAYRQALHHAADPERVRLLKARLARAATVAGDIETAAAVLEGLPLDGGEADPDILLARGHVAYFEGRFDDATDVADEARRRVLSGERSRPVLELISLDGLLAHSRGEWFDRMRVELRTASRDPELTLALFDSYLCPAEYLLYGPTPFAEVAATAASLRATAQRSGALRAVGFAAALAGEAALLAGDLDAAEVDLIEARELHRDIGAQAGEAHCLQRLAEVSLARGDRAQANERLQRALPLARWSLISMHLLQRIFGTMILAAPDAESARAVVDRAESTLGTEDLCAFCGVMLAVPAAIACARVGDVAGAERHLAVAEFSVTMWDGTSWDAAVREAKAELARAQGDDAGAVQLLTEAEVLFERSGQPLDARRCRAGLSA